MNLQHQRIAELCQALKLERVADHYPVLAQQAVREEFSFGDFLEQLLRNEQSFRQQRSRELLTRMACFPAIKTLVRIPRSSGHPFHEHLTTDSTVIRPPIPRVSDH